MLRSSQTSAAYPILHPHQSSRSKIGLVIFAVVASLLLVVAIVPTSSRKKTGKVKTNDVCLTPYCIQAANNLLTSMDESVDPCEDFYNFTCGKWMESATIPSDDCRQSTTVQMVSDMHNAIVDLLTTAPSNETLESRSILNTRRLYNACLNESNIEAESVSTLFALIDTEFGGWPIIQSTAWNESTFDFSDLWFKLSQYTREVFYYAETKPDVLNSSMNSIYFLPSRLSLEYPSLYHEETGHPKSYRRLIRELALALNASKSTLNADVNALFRFEKKLSKFHRLTPNQPVGKNMRMSIDTFQSRTQIHWNLTYEYLHRLYLSNNVLLDVENFVIIKDNYMILRFIMSLIPHLPKRFRTIVHRFQQVTYGIRAEKPRTIVCARYVNENMGFIISKLYVNKYFDESSRRTALELVDSIRNTFIDMINESKWMDPHSKVETIKKAQTIIEEVGYTDYLNDENGTMLESLYSEYNFNSSHMENVLMTRRLNMQRNLQRLCKPVDYRELHDVPPISVNAFYYPLLNRIVVSSAILQPPHFHKNAPKYLNYGGIGTVIGHEIAHGFSDLRHPVQRIENILGRLNQTIDRFDKRSKCLVNQYDNYTEIQANNQTYGNRTIEENIADNEGLTKAYFAYQKWKQQSKTVEEKLPGLTKYSAEQMFFLNYGHMFCSKQTEKFNHIQLANYGHPLSPFRVIGPTSNFIKFDQAFSCKPGQGNSRVNKCTVW